MPYRLPLGLGLACMLATMGLASAPGAPTGRPGGTRAGTLGDRNRNCVFCHIGDPHDRNFTEKGRQEAERRAAAKAAGKKVQPMS
jgi:hypothetical protein